MKRPLHFTGTGRGQAKGPPNRFSTLHSIGGYEVIDSDGRPVKLCQLSTDAEAVAAELNSCAAAGTWAIAGRLDCL